MATPQPLPTSVTPSHVTWSAAAKAALLQLANLSAPREAAAVLGGSISVGGGDANITACIDTIVPLANGASEADRFEVDASSFAAAEYKLRASGHSIVGFAHSHARGSTAPSQRDRAQLWTGCVQAITDGTNVRTFVLDEQRNVHNLTDHALPPAVGAAPIGARK